MTTLTQQSLLRRRSRVRAKIAGTAARPRLMVKISLRHVQAQLIDDTSSRTLTAVTTIGSDATGNMTEKAAWVGNKIAEAAKAKKIKAVVLDRNGRIYHGRLHALADAARAQGLEF